uniref:Uncharacterized protein n=1 Tax=Anguilla anguilla TaxID=7936 RepID=A0A0E9U4C6_ANGAN
MPKYGFFQAIMCYLCVYSYE